MPPLIPPFLLPQWLREAPLPIKLALLLPALLVGGVLGIVVNAVVINLGAGNQHLSTADGGFSELLIWIIVGLGLFLGLAIGGFIYFGVGLGADDDDDDDGGETGLLEI